MLRFEFWAELPQDLIRKVHESESGVEGRALHNAAKSAAVSAAASMV